MSKVYAYLKEISKHLNGKKGLMFLAMELALAITLLSIIVVLLKVFL